MNLQVESKCFSLDNLIEFCQAYFLLRHRIDFRLILINERRKVVEFPVNYP